MTTTTTMTMDTSPDTPLNFMVGSALFYIVVGAGGVMTVLLFIILVLCVAIGILASRKRRSYLLPQTNQPQTARPAQGGERQVTAQNTQQSHGKFIAIFCEFSCHLFFITFYH